MGITGAQHTTTYMKWKYGKWFDAIPEITQPGTYTLKPVSQSPFACYKIPSPVSSTEYFIVEYRKKEGLLESTIPANYTDGLIIYRINTQVPWGNAGGPPDELYMYRYEGGTTQNGDITKAAYSANVSKTAFNAETSPSCFLSNGKPGEIDISNIASAGNEISFTVNAVNPLPKPGNLKATAQNNEVLLSWNSPVKKGYTLLGYNVFMEGNSSPLNTALITDTTYLTPNPGKESIYTYKLTAKFQQGESSPVTCMFLNATNPSVLDSLSLVVLYNQCGGPGWQNNDNWLKGRLSTWYGVTVENGRVVILGLSPASSILKFGLRNSIPKEIGKLTELRQLSFPYNELTGSIPLELGNLKNLEILGLRGNSLTGSIPVELCNITKLNTFDLGENQLTGSIPSGIGYLRNLKYLYLRSNKLSGNIPNEIGDIQSIQSIALDFNDLTGVIPNQLFSLINLNFLSLGGNKLAGQLPIELGNLKQLEVLDLAENDFSGTIPEEIWQLTELTFLNLAGRCTGGNLSGEISPKIGNLKKLKSLQLHYNKFSGSLPPEFGHLEDMDFLWLSDNQFSGEIPNEIGNLTKLWAFRIYNNHFSGSVPKGFALFSNNSDINLANNELEDLPDLTRLKTIIFFNASNNKFTFEDIEPNKKIIFTPGCSGFHYLNQAKIGKIETINVPLNKAYTMSIYCGGKNNRYQWFKNGLVLSEIQTSPEFVINSIVPGNNGEFFCRVTNTIVTDLTIESYPITLIGDNTLIANAGNDHGVDEGTLVTLDGTGSYNPNGNPLIYKWTAPAGITLSETNLAKPTFTAPDVIYDKLYTFSLVVNDGTIDSPANQVIITVKQVNKAPLANAGPDQTIKMFGTGILDGSASIDPDGDALSFRWIIPEGISVDNNNIINPAFITPDISEEKQFIFLLVVNDGLVNSYADTVRITIRPGAACPLDANYNEEPTNGSGGLRCGQSVTILRTGMLEKAKLTIGSGGNSPYLLLREWVSDVYEQAFDGKIIATSNIATNVPSASNWAEMSDFFFPSHPNLITGRKYVFEVINAIPPVKIPGTYSGGQTYDTSNPDYDKDMRFALYVCSEPNNTPNANAGPDQSVNEGAIVILDGAASSVPDGKPLTYKWTAPAGISLSSTTVAKPTFIAPEVTVNTNYTFSLVVNDGIMDSPVDQVVITVNNLNINQDIAINAGWNIISANVIPANLNLKDIFQSLIDAGNLKKVMDETGKTIENFGAFGGWKNNIGNLNSSKGYKVNVTAASSLSLEGSPVQLPLDIALNTGWNIISYPSASSQDAIALVQSLIDSGKLKKVMDETGKTIENFGAFGGWKNNIGNFLSGKGYKVNVNESCVLTIPSDGTKSAIVLPELLASEHFKPVFNGNGTEHMNIHLVNLPTSGLLAGDEIGVFDGKHCVGSATIGAEQLMAGSISIPASANDELAETVNGFTSGHPVELQLYRGNHAFKLNLAKLSGNELFEKDGSLFATIKTNELTIIQTAEESTQFNCFPNPTTGIVNLELTGKIDHKTEISVTSLVGVEIFRKEMIDAVKFQIDLSNQVNGIYMLKVLNGNQQYISKIIVRK